jgi:hypothetical protein
VLREELHPSFEHIDVGRTRHGQRQRGSRHTPAVQYHEAFSDLAGVYLEDSWVLELAQTDHELAFRIDAVLTPAHPGYEPAKPGEQHCYRRGWLRVRGDQIDTHLSGSSPATDATGEEDYGNVDAFVFDPTNDHWLLEGDWGPPASMTRRSRCGSTEADIRSSTRASADSGRSGHRRPVRVQRCGHAGPRVE